MEGDERPGPDPGPPREAALAEGAPLLSVVVPALDEEASIGQVLEGLQAALAELPCASEVVVVDDASRDGTAARAAAVPGVRVVRNPVNLGYGHSLLRGFAAARGELLAMIDADGTYPAAALVELYGMIERGADHAIGQRTGKHFIRLWSIRHVYRWLCRYVAGVYVPDANSGLRVVRREVIESLRGDLCRGFSFTTSLTLASLLSGYVVTHTPIEYAARVGRSHVRIGDVLRTAQYLFQLVAVYNPLKLFLPFVLLAGLLAAAGLGWGLWARSPLGLGVGAVMLAAALVLTGQAALAYVQSRVGLLGRAAGEPGPSSAEGPTRGPR